MTLNSYANYLQGLYAATLDDVVDAYPSLRVDCERDYKRLLSIVEKIGPRYFFVDLPAYGKHFDKCLALGRLTRSELPYSKPFRKRGVIPHLYKGLLLRVFDESGVLRSDSDPRIVGFLRQLYLAAKRFRLPCPNQFTWEQVNEFFRTDGECRAPSLNWDGDDIGLDRLHGIALSDLHNDRALSDDLSIESPAERLSSITLGGLESIQLVADIVSSKIGRFNPLDWRAKHGPGAVSDLRPDEYKYLFGEWPDRLERVFPFADLAFANFGMWADFVRSQDGSSIISHDGEPSSKLIAVPKTMTGPRLIASEPVSFQWCQQMIRDFLATQVSISPIRYSVNFRSQEPNGKLALEASRSQSHSTIDLSSASDRMSCWLVERIFRRIPSLVEAFYSCRTRFIRNDIDRLSPKIYKLRKFTTMGSACTFPVQTYVFTIIAIGTILYERNIPVTIASVSDVSKEVRVFGDDIIVPLDHDRGVRDYLIGLGFKVNSDKSYGTGKFRESCGVDAFDGNDVTKVSILTDPVVSRPESIVSSVDVHNNLLKKGYFRTAEFVKSTVSKLRGIRIPSVGIDSGTFGWSSFEGFDPSCLRSKWDRDRQMMVYYVTKLSNKLERTPSEGNAMLLQYYTEVCNPPKSKEIRLGVASRSITKLSNGWVTETQLLT